MLRGSIIISFNFTGYRQRFSWRQEYFRYHYSLSLPDNDGIDDGTHDVKRKQVKQVIQVK
jgi:hypothetical protein